MTVSPLASRGPVACDAKVTVSLVFAADGAAAGRGRSHDPSVQCETKSSSCS